MKLLYLANIRLPTEKAHGLQIMQMCEAFASIADHVTLMVAHRKNVPEMAKITDPWAYYGVRQSFSLNYIPCLDLMNLAESGSQLEKVIFALQMITYNLFLAVILLFCDADIYYSRDAFTLLLISLLKPRSRLIYEAHTLAKSRLGGWLQSRCVQRVALTVAVTARLSRDLSERGAKQTVTAHDGIRLERFADLPSRELARQKLNLPPDAFIVGYMGRLHTMSMSKGVDLLIEAIAMIKDRAISLGLVGGPVEMTESLRTRWSALDLPAERFLFMGQVSPENVPLCLSTFDVAAMPFPWTEHFAYYASPLKLFEYMAAGRAILSSDLPSTAEVVTNEESALLVPRVM